MTRFTVLIPTRERCETLVHTLASVCAQDYGDLDIVVSDNMSADGTRAAVDAVRDPRVRYINPGRRLSMTGNFEFSLAQATGGYVMHLGDDDGLVPGAIATVARIIAETGTEAVTSSVASYHWPNAIDPRLRGELLYSAQPGYTMLDSAAALARVLRFERSYTELPGTYVSFVHRSVIDRAMAGGRYYHSRTPDSYSGIVNAAVTRSYAMTGPPFAIAGISGRSNGAQQFSALADKAEARAYEAESDIAFHPEVAFAPSLELIVAEAFLQARDHLPALSGHSIDFARLCRIALREAVPASWDAVARAVSETRARHGLAEPRDAAPGGGKPAAIRRAATIARAERGVARLRRGYRSVDASAFGVADVAAAGRLAAILCTYETMGYARPGAALRRWLRKV